MAPSDVTDDAAASLSPQRGGTTGATLDDWLARLEAAHPSEIELGLERVGAVGRQLAVLSPAACVITVAGTNGKGSVAAVLETLLGAAGCRVGLYTSPHLHRFNERMRIATEEVADAPMIAALERVEQARQQAGCSLTYFEHTTLAAFELFTRAECDAWVLEVGLGGRLDAVNLIDPDVAVVTRIALDHTEWLGETLAAVATEKAGIFRSGRPAVIGQEGAPPALYAAAHAVGAKTVAAGAAYRVELGPEHWTWSDEQRTWSSLPYPAIPGRAAVVNVATALAAFAQLEVGSRLSAEAVAAALATVHLTGRLQRIAQGALEWLFDVAHNADGAVELASVLASPPPAGRIHAVLAVARRKDAAALVAALIDVVDRWYLPSLDGAEMYSSNDLATVVAAAGGQVAFCGDLAEGLAALGAQAVDGDRVVVCGSFRTVAAVQQLQGWG